MISIVGFVLLHAVSVHAAVPCTATRDGVGQFLQLIKRSAPMRFGGPVTPAKLGGVAEEACKDVVLAEKQIGGGLVQNIAVCGKRYQITKLEDARAVCECHEAVIASEAQLNEAWKNGLSVCACGWLSNGQIKFPIGATAAAGGCGKTNTINDCPAAQMGKWGGPGWNVFCYKAPIVLPVDKGTVQQSTGDSKSAAKAVDDKPGGDYWKDSCSATMDLAVVQKKGIKGNSWWSVDLVGDAMVTAVTIQNRLDCCSERLSDFEILVDGQNCITHKGTFTGLKKIVCTKPVYGKAIKVQLPNQKELTLCDVKIHGNGVKKCPKSEDSAKGGVAEGQPVKTDAAAERPVKIGGAIEPAKPVESAAPTVTVRRHCGVATIRTKCSRWAACGSPLTIKLTGGGSCQFVFPGPTEKCVNTSREVRGCELKGDPDKVTIENKSNDVFTLDWFLFIYGQSTYYAVCTGKESNCEISSKGITSRTYNVDKL